MIISQHIRDLFAQHIDVMLPLLSEYPEAIEAYIEIAQGGTPLYSSPHNFCGERIEDIAEWVVHLAGVSRYELLKRKPDPARSNWEHLAKQSIHKIVESHDHLPAHT